MEWFIYTEEYKLSASTFEEGKIKIKITYNGDNVYLKIIIHMKS